jgi:hypothetical protein
VLGWDGTWLDRRGTKAKGRRLTYLFARDIVPRMRGRRTQLHDVNDGAMLLGEAIDIEGEAVDADILVPAIAGEVLDCPTVGGAGLEGGWSAEGKGKEG